MGDLTKEAIEVFLKHLTDRVALGLLILSLILLASMAIPGSTGSWARGHATWVAFGVLGPICYLPTRYLFDKWENWRDWQKRKHRLRNLTKREQEILLPYIVNDFRSRRINRLDPVAQGLADDGILYAPDVAVAADAGKAYNIQDWCRVYLKEHIDLVGGNRKPNSDAQGDS
jgi:hypothetical protein